MIHLMRMITKKMRRTYLLLKNQKANRNLLHHLSRSKSRKHLTSIVERNLKRLSLRRSLKKMRRRKKKWKRNLKKRWRKR
jgi:hypothetical protein